MAGIDTHWYRASRWLWLLLPVSLLFCSLVMLRQLCYRLGILKVTRFSVPLIVVGNITVGGSGKTPLVAWLVAWLRAHGYRPGIVSRGYGGKAASWPQNVTPDSDASQVGDEALLLARRCGCPMMVGPQRVAAVEQLLREHQVDVVISDDGMQHYRMGRDLEIAVLDGERRLGNGLCLPAGPLREPPARLQKVDFIVTNGRARAGEWGMTLQPGEVQSLSGAGPRSLSDFAGHKVHAVAAIGNPERFFNTLRHVGLTIIEHPFPDHHPFEKGELDYGDSAPVIMTEKDAVKYFPYATAHHWYLPVSAILEDEFSRQLLERLERTRG